MAAQVVQNPSVQNSSAQKHSGQDNPSHHEERHGHGDSHAALRNRVGEPGSPVGASRNGERSSSGREQNPELLQWRANVLLDEMMLGAVDIAASDVVTASMRPARNGGTGIHEHEEAAKRSSAGSDATRSADHPTTYPNGIYAEDRHPAPVDDQDEHFAPSDPHDEWARPSWHFAEPTVSSTVPSSPMTPSARAAVLQEHTRHHQTPPTAPAVNHRPGGQPAVADLRTTAVGAPPPRPAPDASAPSPTRVASAPSARGASGKSETGKKEAEPWVFAAEQRYQQIAARHQATAVTPVDGASAAWVDPVDALFDDFAGNEYGLPGAGSAATRGGRSRGAQSARRTNLLPRMSNLDPRALQQEMVLLQTEIEQALPAGHESRERALHLLQKAYTILHADPSRSAEVDYYLQQVRTIGQRVQETLRWSHLYHSRLNFYLGAWTALSLIVIAARYFYQDGLGSVIGTMTGVDAAVSLVPHNLLTILTGFFGGALGGALGAFINMRQYGRIKQGFFDRKYSLRGLILPLIGGIVGLILCLFFGLFYYLFNADPATNWLLGALPALLAFAFGIAQEFLYGTRS